MEDAYEKRGYLLEDYRLFHLHDAQGTKPDFHYHEFSKIIFLCSGSGGYSVNGQRYTLIPGDIVLVGSRCIHRPEFEPGVPYERIILYISPTFLKANSSEDCQLNSCFSEDGGHVLRLSERPRKRLFALVDQLEQDLSESGYGSSILANGDLTRLLVELIRTTKQSDISPISSEFTENRRVAEIIRYLNEHLTEDLTIDHLAQHFFLSKYHMMRLFRAETGDSIHSYLSQRRLLYARDLIAQGYSATESCFRCGWKSYSSFTRAYSRFFGTTPTGRMNLSSKVTETYE